MTEDKDILKKQLATLSDTSVLGTPIRIADNELNQINEFFRPLIGQEGVLIDCEADGLYDISLPTQPLLQGIKADRFVVLGPAPVSGKEMSPGTVFRIEKAKKEMWKTVWGRFELTVVIVFILSAILLVLKMTL